MGKYKSAGVYVFVELCWCYPSKQDMPGESLVIENGKCLKSGLSLGISPDPPLLVFLAKAHIPL